MKNTNRKELIWTVVGELARWWMVSCLLYFLAVAAQVTWLMFLLEVSIVGIPVFLSTSFISILAGALYFYTLNRMAWERHVYYVGMQERVQRLSITDVSPGDVHRYLQTEQDRLERLR